MECGEVSTKRKRDGDRETTGGPEKRPRGDAEAARRAFLREKAASELDFMRKVHIEIQPWGDLTSRFRLRPSMICRLHFLALDGFQDDKQPGAFRSREVASKHPNPDPECLARLGGDHQRQPQP